MRKSRHSRRIVPTSRSQAALDRGRLRRRSQHALAHGGNGLIQFLGEDAVPIVKEEAERMITGQCFPQLLQGPFPTGVIGGVDVQDSSPTQFQQDEYIKDTECQGRSKNRPLGRRENRLVHG